MTSLESCRSIILIPSLLVISPPPANHCPHKVIGWIIWLYSNLFVLAVTFCLSVVLLVSSSSSSKLSNTRASLFLPIRLACLLSCKGQRNRRRRFMWSSLKWRGFTVFPNFFSVGESSGLKSLHFTCRVCHLVRIFSS